MHNKIRAKREEKTMKKFQFKVWEGKTPEKYFQGKPTQ